jgi:hypothetical protein
VILQPGTGLPEEIFADDFESGDFRAWTQHTLSSDLTVTTTAALSGTYGMWAAIAPASQLSLTATDGRPNAEQTYRASFLFDPNSLSTSDEGARGLFYGYQNGRGVALGVELRYVLGSFRVRARALNDNNTISSTTFFLYGDQPRTLEVEWQAASSPGANDGRLAFWIDGVLKAEVATLDNDTGYAWQVDYVRMGGFFLLFTQNS